MIIRAAGLPDAAAMSLLRAASVRHLCHADHHDDPAAIASWIGDHSPTKFIVLLQRQDVSLIVAEVDTEMVGLAGLSGDLVTLNYVHPAYRFQGVSKALMAALEQRMRDHGIGLGRLNSTATARRFYRSIGWSDAGAGTPEQGYPMEKRL